MGAFSHSFGGWEYDATWKRGENATVRWSAVVCLGGGVRGRPSGTIHRAPATDDAVDSLVMLAVETAIDGGVGVELPVC
ncbi:hypothetical protein QFZ41_003234 [Luteibacter sp. W1I16]